MRKNSIKNTRINSEVQRELSSIISRELKDPRIHPMTTVVSVEVTPDLKYCKAYISVLGNEEAAKDTIQGLKSAVGFVRTQLAKRINLRNTPEITFILDQSIEYPFSASEKSYVSKSKSISKGTTVSNVSATIYHLHLLSRYFASILIGQHAKKYNKNTTR